MTTIEKANGQGLNKSQYKNKVFTPKEMIDYSDGGIVSKELIHTQAGSVTLFSFDEGQQLSEHSAPLMANRRFSLMAWHIIPRQVMYL